MKLRFTFLWALPTVSAFVAPSSKTFGSIPASKKCATVAPTSESSSPSELVSTLLEKIENKKEEGTQWAGDFGLGEGEGGFYSVFAAIRETNPLGLRGQPFVLKAKDLEAVQAKFGTYFSFEDLAKAVDADFLDAGRGTTDNRKGWKMTTVNNPRGQSFEEARMTFKDVQEALEKGTVVFNSAGAHIPKLAGASLACVDATALPNALNMYVTAPGKRTSAPPHTDKQDVLVVQTSGKKHWRVYSPPIPSIKPSADMFARGKGDDNLPLFSFEKDFGSELLLETTLEAGDALFVPAAFPHTTDTAEEGLEETSIHLTFGVDTHIWNLDYLQVRRLAYRRAQVKDTALGQMEDSDNPYVGAVNELPRETVADLMEALPMGLLEDTADTGLLEEISANLERIATAVDEKTASDVGSAVWLETSERVLQHGREMLDIHRDMYLAAIEEGRLREAEDAMTSHIDKERKPLTPQQMQRLSVFRVKNYFDKIGESNTNLMAWSHAGEPKGTPVGGGSAKEMGGLPADWAFTMPVNVNDIVEADLGGAFFPATVTRASGNTYDVQYFDGDRDTGLDRSMIKLLKPPAQEDEVDTSAMTPKQLKRWKKQQEKKNKK